MATILQINTIAVNGSTGRIVDGIGEAALAQGYDSFIAYGRNKPSISKSQLIRIGNEFDVREHVLETRLFDMQGKASRNATRKLLRQIEAINPDIIHLHNLHGNYLNYKILFEYLKDKNIPVVWTLHDCWAFTGHCVHFTDAKCFKWKIKSPIHCCNCPKKKRYPNSYWFDRSAKNFIEKKNTFTQLKNVTIVPVSHWLGSVVAESFLSVYPIHVIQNGIDIDVFYPRLKSIEMIRHKYGIGKRFMILGVATGWSDDVGYSDFLWLRQKLSNEQFAIVMVGLTDSQIKKLPMGIIGINRTWDAGELAALYTTADVMFNGSFQETFGLVTAESMACGTPVIVYNSTACPEIVTEQETGYIIPVGDRCLLINRILLLAQNEDRSSVNQNCVNYVRKNLSKQQKYDEYVDLYNSLLRRKVLC